MFARRSWLASALLTCSALVALAADDPYGDPIPEGATARLGTTRMRTFYGGPTTITPDGKFLAGQSPTGGVAFHEPATGKVVRTVKLEGGFSTPVGFSANGKRAVNTAYDHCFVWEVDSGKTAATIKRPTPGGDNGLALSADGKRLAIGGVRRDKDTGTTVVVWDVDANKALATVTPVQNETAYVALSPDGKRLATWGYNYDRTGKGPPKPEADPARQVQFWDAATGKETAKVTVAGGYTPSGVVFAPDSSLAATSGGNGAVYLFDSATGAAKGLLLGRSRQGRRIAFSPDGKTIAACGDDGSIQRWAISDGKRLDTTEPPAFMAYGPRAIVFADNERIIAWATRGVMAVVWEAPSGKLLSPGGGHSASVHSAAIPGGGQEILTAGQDGQILRWNPTTGKELGSIALKVPGVAPGFGYSTSATLTRDGTRALANEGSGGLAIYDLPAGTQAFVIPGDSNRDNRGAFTPDGSKVVQVLTSYDVKKTPARVVVWDVAAAKQLGQVELPGVGFPSAVVTPDGKILVTAGTLQDEKGGNAQFTVTGWELATGKKLGEYTEPGGFGAAYIAATADNKSVVATTSKGSAVIDATTGQKVRDLEIERGGQSSAAPAISPDGKTAAILIGGGFGPNPTGKVVLVDLESGKTRKTLNGVSGNPSVAVFSADGKLLVTGSQDTTALVWDLSK